MENNSTKASLVHIAVRAENPSRLAEFYKGTFDMKIVLRGRGAVDLLGRGSNQPNPQYTGTSMTPSTEYCFPMPAI